MTARIDAQNRKQWKLGCVNQLALMQGRSDGLQEKEISPFSSKIMIAVPLVAICVKIHALKLKA